MRQTVMALSAAALLAGCVVEDGRRPGLGPGAPGVGGMLAEARSACIARAEGGGLRVTQVVSQEPISGAGGRVTGARIVMETMRGGARSVVTCDYTYANRRAVIYSPGPGLPGAPPPDDGREQQVLVDARRACIAQAERQGLRVDRVRSQTPVWGSGGRVIGAALELAVRDRGRTATVRCDYDRASGRAVIRDTVGPGPGPGGPSEAEVLAQARRVCLDRAAEQGYQVRRVRSQEAVFGPGGRVTGARLELGVRIRNENYGLRCDYDAASGRARLSRPF